jgi:hypothetical protein
VKADAVAAEAQLATLIKSVAVLIAQQSNGWQTFGEPGDQLQYASVDFGTTTYRILRGKDGAVLVFTSREWRAFRAGARNAEFNEDAGISPGKVKESA